MHQVVFKYISFLILVYGGLLSTAEAEEKKKCLIHKVEPAPIAIKNLIDEHITSKYFFSNIENYKETGLTNTACPGVFPALCKPNSYKLTVNGQVITPIVDGLFMVHSAGHSYPQKIYVGKYLDTHYLYNDVERAIKTKLQQDNTFKSYYLYGKKFSFSYDIANFEGLNPRHKDKGINTSVLYEFTLEELKYGEKYDKCVSDIEAKKMIREKGKKLTL